MVCRTLTRTALSNHCVPPPPPGAVRKHPTSGHWLDKGGFRLFKGSDRPPGFDPASWNILRPEHKVQVLKDLKSAEQAGGVGGLHASLPSDAKDEPGLPSAQC